MSANRVSPREDALQAAWRAMDEAHTELLDDLSPEARRARIILRNGKGDLDAAIHRARSTRPVCAGCGKAEHLGICGAR